MQPRSKSRFRPLASVTPAPPWRYEQRRQRRRRTFRIASLLFALGVATTTASRLAGRNQKVAGQGGKIVRVKVAPNGSGDFITIQQAIDHAPPYGAGRLEIVITPGVYHERLMIPQNRPRLTLVGLGKDPAATVITNRLDAKQAGGTFFSSTVEVQAEGFHARNLTFRNTYGPGSQAVAISIHSDRAVFCDCRFIGYQDTLYAATGRQYYSHCLIEGAVDYIFGNATAVFDHCEIRSVGHGYITAQSRTRPKDSTGFVFNRCRLTGNGDVYLGRPWRPFARVVYLRCWMEGEIRPAGWDNWRNPENEKTATFAEFKSSGPRAKSSSRAAWSHQFHAREASSFAPKAFLRGSDGWNPKASCSGK